MALQTRVELPGTEVCIPVGYAGPDAAKCGSRQVLIAECRWEDFHRKRLYILNVCNSTGKTLSFCLLSQMQQDEIRRFV